MEKQIFHLLIHVPNGPNCQGWANQSQDPRASMLTHQPLFIYFERDTEEKEERSCLCWLVAKMAPTASSLNHLLLLLPGALAENWMGSGTGTGTYVICWRSRQHHYPLGHKACSMGLIISLFIFYFKGKR